MAAQQNPVRRNLRNEQRLHTNRVLRQAATEVIAERGYAATTIDDIVERAGVSRATFYLHFNDKEDVVNALLADALTIVPSYYATLDDALESGEREKLRSWVEVIVSWYDENGAVFAIAEDLLSRDPTNDLLALNLRELMPKFSKRWKKRLTEGHLRVYLLVSALSRARMLLRLTGAATGPLGEDELLDILTSIFAASLEPTAGAS